MTTINTMSAMRSATRFSTRMMGPSFLVPARALHLSAPTRKDPPLKGPMPTEEAEEVKEGGDGFLGVSQSAGDLSMQPGRS
jgi:hypothetical protein